MENRKPGKILVWFMFTFATKLLYMKILLILPFVLLAFSYSAQDAKYVFNKVEVHCNVPGMGEGKLKRFSATIEKYITSIETGDYDTWYGLLSDSTISRVAPHKMPRKFARLKEYGIKADTIKIVEAKLLKKAYQNEMGSEYQVILEFPNKLNTANRVSFDPLKTTTKDQPNRIGMNLIVIGKESSVCIRKYIAGNKDKNGDGQSNH